MIVKTALLFLNVSMLSLKSDADMLAEVAAAVRSQRVALRWRQQDLATRSGVSIATLRRFERSGEIGFRGLAKLLVTLGLADQVLRTFQAPAPNPRNMNDFLNAGVSKAPQRVRRPRVA